MLQNLSINKCNQIRRWSVVFSNDRYGNSRVTESHTQQREGHTQPRQLNYCHVKTNFTFYYNVCPKCIRDTALSWHANCVQLRPASSVHRSKTTFSRKESLFLTRSSRQSDSTVKEAAESENGYVHRCNGSLLANFCRRKFSPCYYTCV